MLNSLFFKGPILGKIHLFISLSMNTTKMTNFFGRSEIESEYFPNLENPVQLPPLLVQVLVDVPPPVLNLHQLRLQGGLGLGVSRQQQAAAGLHRQDVAAMLPVEAPLSELHVQRRGERAEWQRVN